MRSEVEAERARLQRLGVNVPDIVEPEKPVDPEVPVDPEKPVDPEVPVDPEKPVDPEVPVEPEVPQDTYDSAAIYVKGDTVVYNGETYVCKWWTQGVAPGSQWGPWE